MSVRLSVILFLLVAGGHAQSGEDLKSILNRLERLERENRELREEVSALRELVVSSSPSSEQVRERLDIVGSRVEEQAQTKVESSQKFPLRITGMALFNVFHNGRHSGGFDTPITASATAYERVAGATFRQSIIGLEYRGPKAVLGAAVHGSLTTDFFDGSKEPAYNPLRLRTAEIGLDWKTRGVSVGYQKPIFNPRDPASLAQVGFSPLTGAGNLWHWQPQIRFEQRLQFSAATSLRATVGALQTSEEYGESNPNLELEARRPGVEGRFELAHRFDDTRRIEVAPGFHASTSHVDEVPVPSSLFSLDWLANPWRRIEFTGVFFRGRNIGHFGGLGQGFRVIRRGVVRPVHAMGGWAQLTVNATERLSLHFMTGQQDDRNSDLNGFGIAKNLAAGANAMYRLAPNVIVSFEALQMRTNWIGSGAKVNNRYDLAIAYLF